MSKMQVAVITTNFGSFQDLAYILAGGVAQSENSHLKWRSRFTIVETPGAFLIGLFTDSPKPDILLGRNLDAFVIDEKARRYPEILKQLEIAVRMRIRAETRWSAISLTIWSRDMEDA